MAKVEKPPLEPQAGERRPTLGEDIGALGCSVVLFLGGGALITFQREWGNWASIAGVILTLVAVVTGNVTLLALLRRLWRRGRVDNAPVALDQPARGSRGRSAVAKPSGKARQTRSNRKS